MLEHPATQRNLRQLRSDGVTIVEPDAGEMACGTIGPGRLSDPERIVQAALELLHNNSAADLTGERILITVGATRESIDPVRFLSNRSSGRMGYALAMAAMRRGAEVIAVAGSTSVLSPPGVDLLQVSSAEEMRNAVNSQLAHATIFIGAAAVADYRPVVQADQKIKKSNEHLILELERTPDILSEVAKNRNSRTIVVGFAAETENVVIHAKHKLETKALDAIIANDVSRTDSGFESELNAVTILLKGGTSVDVPLSTKETIADRVLDAIVSLRKSRNSKPHAAS
jgi:phosphopantothenoylcysteine decarboxylase / phosphopantothenate---cysteine ligase